MPCVHSRVNDASRLQATHAETFHKPNYGLNQQSTEAVMLNIYHNSSYGKINSVYYYSNK